MNTDAIYGFNRLNAAAHAGDVDLLYTIIQDDPYILERIELIPFVETPLHVAASMGHRPFSSEIMNLKPSFATKLNPQGFSPIHLAMQNDQKLMVYSFVNMNKDLVRVKGRDGLTPLHFASQIGEVDLLVEFLFLCPESIECLTVRRETALHIAVKSQQYEALQVLVGWLETNIDRGAQRVENSILNKKDEAGNTILHISALSSEPQAVLLLVRTRINLKERNLEDKTALDIATTTEMKSILFSAGSKPGIEVADATKRVYYLRSKTTTMFRFFIHTIRTRTNLTEEQRNAWLIVATLIATTMYESVLTPPGGLYQISAGDNNLNITSSNSIISTPKNVGRSVLSITVFMLFSVSNMITLLMSILTIVIMTPSWRIFSGPVMSVFLVCYMVFMMQICPSIVNAIIVVIIFYLTSLCLVVCGVIMRHAILQRKRNAKKLSRS